MNNVWEHVGEDNWHLVNILCTRCFTSLVARFYFFSNMLFVVLQF
jgi:hypothetical protein